MMKRYFFIVVSLLACCALFAQQASFRIVPKPQTLVPHGGNVVLAKAAKVYCQSNMDKSYLVEIMMDMGLEPRFVDRAAEADLVLQIDRSGNAKPESYRLAIKSNAQTAVSVSAADMSGVIYALQTLRQLVSVNQRGEVEIPGCTIEDQPAFSWRAFMLDESRHFQGEETVKRLLDEMSRLKMNTFHWHLVDDQGWRIEIKKYPKLVSIGSKRDFSHMNLTPAQWDSIHPKRTYYTQAEIKNIVRYAAARGIRVIPEIEMPGHASAAITSYPWLGSSSRREKKPIHGDLYQVSDKKVMAFLKNVMSEVIPLFPSKIVHVGGDEAGFVHWQNSEEVQAFMKKNNIPTPSDLQLWAINEMSRFIESKGCRMIGWNEITGDNIRNEAGVQASQSQTLAPNSIVQFWDGAVTLIHKAISKGYDVVNSNRFYTYLDYPYTVTPLDKAYSFNPCPDGLSAAEQSKVLGSGCQMWGEFTPNLTRLYYQIFPRLAAYAECGWTPAVQKDYSDFCERVKPVERRWRRLGYFNTQPSFSKQDDTFTLWQLPTQINTIGNAYVVKTDNGKILVFDGGVKEEEGYLRGFLAGLGNVVDCWFVTHPHPDHMGALTKILKEPKDVRILQVCHSTLTEPLLDTEKASKAEAMEYYEALKKSGIPTVEAALGQELVFGHTVCKILAIRNEDIVKDYNNSSMVIRIADPVKSFLMLGDCGPEEGDKLLKSAYRDDLNCDYVQISHHGNNGASMDFYRAIKFRACFWPTPSWVYNNDVGKGFNTHEFTTITTRSTIDALGISEQYVSYQGLAKIE